MKLIGIIFTLFIVIAQCRVRDIENISLTKRKLQSWVWNTLKPTRKPSKAPSKSPSFQPSKGPTQKPTILPSKEPSVNPTIVPTKVLTTSPSFYTSNKSN